MLKNNLAFLKRPKLVLFDYGETLAHEDDFRPEAGYAAILREASSNPCGLTVEAALESYREAFFDLRAQALKLGMELPIQLTWKWFFERYDLQFARPIAEIEEIFWNAAAPCTPTPGMPELLQALRKCGIQTGVISNMSFAGASLQRRLEKLFPEHRFAAVLSSADYGFRKPNSRLFELALRKCNCPAADAWFIGDNLCADVIGACNAGMTAVHYTRDLGCAYRKLEAVHEKPPCIETDDWAELQNLILQL